MPREVIGCKESHFVANQGDHPVGKPRHLVIRQGHLVGHILELIDLWEFILGVVGDLILVVCMP